MKTVIFRVVVFCAPLWLAACGGGGAGTNDNASSPPRASVAAAVANSTPSNACPNGGITVETGLDSNGNGVLDASEVKNTQYVCHGASGSQGLNALLLMSTEAAGANCVAGGTRIDSGLDANTNNQLDTAEISATRYICNGGTGATGVAGSAGLNSLLTASTEAAGANCVNGGIRSQSGLDSNRNGILENDEVTATNYVCNGAPAGMAWVTVTGNSIQAKPNTGYVAANDTQPVVITLPDTAQLAPNDVVRVHGVGAGGWQLAQNAGQSVNFRNLGLDPGVNWTAQEFGLDWMSVASSSDGMRLVAVVHNGQIYTSSDGGQTWTARESTRDWWSVASSSDGTRLVAVVHGGQIYTSIDAGVTWIARESNRDWVSVASSSDGIRLVALVSGGYIYTSVDGGQTWIERETNRDWQSVASSSDGIRMVVVVKGGQIYTSSDGGASWTARETNRRWWSVASSLDGGNLVAVVANGQIYTSSDGGITWVAHESKRNWTSVASSSNGTHLVALAVSGGHIYTSTDSGLTWTARESERLWKSVASSSDGSRLTVVNLDGQIYTSTSWTTAGTIGSLSGEQFDAVELQYVGNGKFNVLSYGGTGFKVK